MNIKALCAEYERRIDKIIPRTITEHADHIEWLAEYKGYRVQVQFFDGHTKTVCTIVEAAVHRFDPDEMHEERTITQRWEVDIMPVVVATICALDELRWAVMEDQWKSRTNG